MQLLIISDTGISNSGDELTILEPPLREIESLDAFTKIIWLGYKEKNTSNHFRSPLKNNIKIIPMPSSGGDSFYLKLRILLFLPFYVWKIYNSMKSADVLHVRLPSIPGIIAIILNVFFKIDTGWIKYAGTWSEKARIPYRIQRLLIKKYRGLPSTILSDAKEFDHLFAIPNPVLSENDLIKNNMIAENKDFTKKINLLFVGRLDKNKRPDVILKAISGIVRHENFGSINFVGDGILFEELKIKAKQISSKIFFRGFCSRNEIDYYYSISHMLICPSKSEGFPKVIAESISFGCVILANSLDGIKSYIKHEDNGFLVNESNLVEELETCLNQSFENPKILKKMSINSTKLSRHFTYENFKENILSIYKYSAK